MLCQNCRSLRIDLHNGSVRVNKCCEPNEILVNLRCIDANQTNEGITECISFKLAAICSHVQLILSNL